MPQEHISLIRDSPCVPRTLQMQLKRINICRVLRRWNQSMYMMKIFSLELNTIFLNEVIRFIVVTSCVCFARNLKLCLELVTF